MNRTLIAAASLALAATLAGCGGDDEPKADPTPTKSATPSSSATSTPEPTWDDKYSPAQLKRYRGARDRWLEFWRFYTEAARRGVDAPGVKSGFEQYSMSPLGEYSNFLDTYVRGGARMEVPPEVLWTSATKIGKDTVDFRYCLDNTNIRITVDGKVTPQKKPYLVERTIRMRKTSRGWLKERYLNDERGEDVHADRTVTRGALTSLSVMGVVAAVLAAVMLVSVGPDEHIEGGRPRRVR